MSAPDPAGDFASDTHRRVLAAVPIPDEDAMEDVAAKTANDTELLDLSDQDVDEILKDLEADGHATKLKSGWRKTKNGHTLLTGPPKEEREREDA